MSLEHTYNYWQNRAKKQNNDLKVSLSHIVTLHYVDALVGEEPWCEIAAAFDVQYVFVMPLVPKPKRQTRTTHTTYSLRFPIRIRLGQRHGHQSITLISLFYKNIYWKVIYIYSYESNFQDKSIYMIFTFSNSST
jgi:hypothetical protein